ncbi:T9SS type A sorting domain-containing protein [bacterium]|nr:T9SS type A sorting domain-containing protein [bacterium]
MRHTSLLFATIMLLSMHVFGQSKIIDHTCTDITQITQSAIEQAKSNLHIGYGHTSHGGQITTGMNGLISFANGGGKGMSHPADIFAWNNGGSGGALDLEEGASYSSGWLERDAGYWPTWYNETREYLDDATHSDVNVIMWSWCGQLSSNSEAVVISEYLNPMAQLETDYPGVTFVYMTGHSDGTGLTGNLHLRNQQIRNYCIANDKWLFDFYDIECYNPDGSYFGDKNVSDDCSYTGGNWATEWRATHTEGVDWYSCSSAHSDALNANQKAYAAWWLFARLAGWDISLAVSMSSISAEITDEGLTLHWRTESELDCAGFHIWRRNENSDTFVCLTSELILARGSGSEAVEYKYVDITAKPGKIYIYQIEEHEQNGQKYLHNPVRVFNKVQPQSFVLEQNYPNPFNPETKISFSVAPATEIKLAVYSIDGRMVRVLKSGVVNTGRVSISWDGLDNSGRQAASGVYILSLISNNEVLTRKMTLLR